MNRTDIDGTWISPDGGITWMLTEPSQAWEAARANTPQPEPVPDPLAALLAALADAQSLEEVRQAAAAAGGA